MQRISVPHYQQGVAQPKTVMAISTVIAAALLTWGAYPVIGSPVLIWGALVPLILLCRVLPPPAAFLCGLAYGALAMQLICHWVYVVAGFRWYHGLPLALYLGLFPALWCLCCALFGRRQLSFLLPGAALWVLLDYAKAHAGFLSFPWASLAHSQYELTPLLQISSVTGEYGVTFLIVLVNIALAEWLVFKRPAAVVSTMLVVGAALLYGSAVEINATHNPEQQIAIAIVQPSILRGERQSAEGRAASFARLAALTRLAAAGGADLIVLPETALRLDPYNDDQVAKLTAIVGEFGVPILFGAAESEKFEVTSSHQDRAGFSSAGRVRWHNSAFLSLPGNGEPVVPYRKQRLVPFGEYNPIPDWLELPEWLVPATGNVNAGQDSRLFVLPDGTTVAPVICWEILFADLIRDGVSNARPDLIAHLTNSNWFGFSAAAAQQNSAAVFRAIEQRTPVVIAANTGPSVLLDAFGRRSASYDEMFQPARFVGRITPGSAYAATFYQRNGNVFVLLCLVLFCSISTAVFIFSSIARRMPISARILSFKQERLS